MELSDGRGNFSYCCIKKHHLISCEATCVHEEVAKRIPHERFYLWGEKQYSKSQEFAHTT